MAHTSVASADAAVSANPLDVDNDVADTLEVSVYSGRFAVLAQHVSLLAENAAAVASAASVASVESSDTPTADFVQFVGVVGVVGAVVAATADNVVVAAAVVSVFVHVVFLNIVDAVAEVSAVVDVDGVAAVVAVVDFVVASVVVAEVSAVVALDAISAVSDVIVVVLQLMVCATDTSSKGWYNVSKSHRCLTTEKVDEATVFLKQYQRLVAVVVDLAVLAVAVSVGFHAFVVVVAVDFASRNQCRRYPGLLSTGIYY